MSITVEAVQKLRDLWVAETDPSRAQKLEEEYRRLSDTLISLADADIKEHAAALEAATVKVGNAVDDLEKAIRENKKVAEAIAAIAEAINLVVETAKLIKP